MIINAYKHAKILIFYVISWRMENNSASIFEGLNPEQLQAVRCVEGPVLIVAGAGSGKTRVLTSRIANILASGADPSGVLALTFTKKAATEMKERIAVMVGEKKARRLYMGTFHSVFVRLMREFAELLGYPSSFTIYDTSDSVSAIKACIKELGLDDKIYKPKDVLSRISSAKNNLYTARAYAANSKALTEDAHSRRPRVSDIFVLYEAKCRQAGVMDFDDILLNMNILLRDHPEALDSIAQRFTHILVDEYQDTNYAQYVILRRLTKFHHNLCVVGDDSQSIYAFRGAKIANIINFSKDYPEAKTFRLERNYRSTKTIVEAANSLIAKNSSRIPKECYSMGEGGELIHLLSSWSEGEEAKMVAGEIVNIMQKQKAEYKDFAILYRTNSQSRALEDALRGRNLPYMIYSGNSFFERAEIKDFMAYFKLVANPNDDEAFKRAVNKPARGIGDTTMNALVRVASEQHLSLFKAAYAEGLEAMGLRAAAIAKVRAFCEMISILASQQVGTDAHEMALRIADKSGLYADFKQDSSFEGQARVANIDELLNSVAIYVEEQVEAAEEDADMPAVDVVTLAMYLENVSLLSNVDVAEDEDSTNRIALMTVHSSKGLEFPYVFITGLEENLFPSGGMLASPADIEEERRLFYVALTRAKKQVGLAFAHTRMRNGKHESNPPSRFIREIDPVYISNPLGADEFDIEPEEPSFGRRGFGDSGSSFRSYGGGTRTFGGQKQQNPVQNKPKPVVSARPLTPLQGRPAPKPADPNFVASPSEDFRKGQRIEHANFGEGTILDIVGSSLQGKAVVRFDSYGEKQILLKYGKMRILE